jgi:hypothetical protein
MKTLASVLGLAAFLLNPNLACSGLGEEDKFQYGAAEMKAAVEGVWEAKVAYAGESAEFRFQVAQATSVQTAAHGAKRLSPREGWVQSAHACSDRSLIASAAACESSSSMPLTASYVSGDTKLGSMTLWATEAELKPTTGVFSVFSLVMASGYLSVHLAEVALSATVAPDGGVTQASASLRSGERVAVQLVRLK